MKAYEAGKLNFDVPTENVERLAKDRAFVCGYCSKNVPEPIEELQVSDELIPEISNRMCDACGCSLPYLLRQNIKNCKLNRW